MDSGSSVAREITARVLWRSLRWEQTPVVFPTVDLREIPGIDIGCGPSMPVGTQRIQILILPRRLRNERSFLTYPLWTTADSVTRGVRRFFCRLPAVLFSRCASEKSLLTTFPNEKMTPRLVLKGFLSPAKAGLVLCWVANLEFIHPRFAVI